VELQRIVQEGKRIRTALLEVRVVASPLVLQEGPRTRVGLIVPRFRQSAVSRNRVKRRLRELTRTRLLPSDVAADIVIRIRPEAYQAAFAALATDVDRILAQLLKWRTPDSQQSPPLGPAADPGASDI
jgi:ribonuclease P protein component